MVEIALGNLLSWGLQVATLAVLGLLLPLALGLTSPHARVVYLRGLLLACLLLPLVQPWVPTPPIVPGATMEPRRSAMFEGTAPGAGSAVATVPSPVARPRLMRRWPIAVIVGAVYLVGLILRLVWTALGLLSLARLRRTSTPLNPRPPSVDDALLMVGVQADFRVSAGVVRPATFGLCRPVVLVPPEFLAFPSAQQTAVAAHELLHVRRRDWVRAFADGLLLSVFWFHPVFWWLVEQIHLSVEQVVDYEVVGLVGDRKPYLEALLKLAAAGPTPILQPASLFLKHGHLAQRVALLVREVSMSRLRLIVSFAAVLTVLATSGWFVVQAWPLRAAPGAPAVAEPQRETDTVSLEFQGADIRTVLRTFSEITGREVTIDPGISGPMDVRLVNMPWQKALEFICRAHGLAYRLDGSVIRVEKPGNLAIGMSPGSGQQTRPTVDPKTQAARPGMPAPPPPPAPPQDEASMVKAIKANPEDVSRYFALSSFYEKAGRLQEAERVLSQARSAQPNDARVPTQMGAFYLRHGDFDKAVDAFRERATLDPSNPEGPYILANVYWERAYRTAELTPAQKRELIEKGLGYADEALRLKPDYVNALACRIVLLRLQATLSDDPAEQQRLIAQAATASDEVVRLQQERPPWPAIPSNAVRLGGNIRPPTKVKDVSPAYPPDAKDARVQGVVILEVIIGSDGKVDGAKVLRSIPMLDQAAIDAVTQWEFTPTLVNGVPVPVVMTATVNFMVDGSSSVVAAPPPPAGSASGGVPGGVAGGVAGGVRGGVAGGVAGSGPVGGIVSSGYPPGTVRVGGNIRPPQKLVDVNAVYPPDAKDARVQGVIILEVLIGTTGKVEQAKVLRSIPMLDQAAIDAVTQWEFTQTMIDGIPVPVLMVVTVNFTLQ